MPKRKKHPRLPNAFGSIRYIGKGRTNPFAVHPPCTEISEAGDYVRPKALCYVRDWYVGFSVLMAYHAGTYQPGTEEQLQKQREQFTADLDVFCERILSDFSSHARIESEKAGKDEHGIPFTGADLGTIWEHRNDNETAEMLIIMCYSGMRISEYKITKVDLDSMQFIGGLKSKAGKNCVVPVRSAIMDSWRKECSAMANYCPANLILSEFIWQNTCPG